MRRKTKFKWILALAPILVIGCGGDDTPTAFPEIPEVENNAPRAFNLLNVPNAATDVDVTPEFSWEEAIDPDMDDNITYTFYISRDSNPQTAQGIDLVTTSYQISERLELYETYYWQVVAKDFLGATTESPVFSFQIRGLSLSEGPLSLSFGGSFFFDTAVFNNALWYIGGVDSFPTNEVWSSSDGSTWAEALPSGRIFEPRFEHTVSTFKNKLFVIGGVNVNIIRNVWSTNNGNVWIPEANPVNFPARRSHSTVIFDGRMWVIGGIGDAGALNDVWYTEDGVIWEVATSNAEFSPRSHHITLIFDDKMWVIGGVGSGFTRLNDIWFSKDGANWTLATEDPAFPRIERHAGVVYDNKMWVVGGEITPEPPISVDSPSNQFWYSKDGINWTLASLDTDFPGRLDHTLEIFDGKIWVIGGRADSGLLDDVWVFD
ncbi:MAG: kelch repeat-containing protein [Bacteroidota bacterium]